jgi:hypothetical protein
MFQEERFLEGTEQSATLEEIDGVVSTRSFDMLVQWVLHNRIVFGDLPPAESIGATIEFARLADMVGLTVVESLMAEHLRQTILANAPAQDSVFVTPPDEHTYHLRLEHIRAGVQLPKRHPVRTMLASAAVKGCLLRNQGKNFKETQSLPDFAVDVLREVGVALESLESEKRGMTFADPFSEQRVQLK